MIFIVDLNCDLNQFQSSPLRPHAVRTTECLAGLVGEQVALMYIKFLPDIKSLKLS